MDSGAVTSLMSVKDLITYFLVTIFLLGIAEGATRIFWFTQWHNHEQAKYDEKWGWKHTPGFYGPDSPIGFSGQVNSLGYRGKEWQVNKTPGVLRIMMIGDSVVLGLGSYRPDGGIPNALERLLNESGIKAEVLNAGVAANTSEQVVYRYEELRAYKPDILLISVGSNDMAEQNPRTIPSKVKDHWMRKLAQHSYFMRAFFGVVYKKLVPMMAQGQDTRRLLDDLNDYSPEFYKENLRRIVRRVQADNGLPILLTIPSQFNAVDYDDSKYKPTDFLYGQSVYTYRALLFRYNRAIQAVAFGEHCAVIDVDGEFQAESPDLFFDYIHPTDEGNDFYAWTISEELRPYIAIARKP